MSLEQLGELIGGTFDATVVVGLPAPLTARATVELDGTSLVQLIDRAGTSRVMHVVSHDRGSDELVLHTFDGSGPPTDPPARAPVGEGFVFRASTADGECRTEFVPSAQGFRWRRSTRSSPADPWRCEADAEFTRPVPAGLPDAVDAETPDGGTAPGTFGHGRDGWLARSGHIRNVVRQELITRQLARHLPGRPLRVLDVGAGQGLQSIRLARAGHTVVAVEPDGVMRERFAAALAGEGDDVRARTTLVAGSLGAGLVDAVRQASGAATFDLVLLLGVLMYVPSAEQALADVAPCVAPGGVLAVATRTTVSALWRPAAREDWTAALHAFDEDRDARREGRDARYVNEIGAPALAVDLDRFVAAAATHGLALERWYGVRTAVDQAELDPLAPDDPRELDAIIDVEQRLGELDPFRRLAQLAHLVFRRDVGRPDGGTGA